MLMHISIAGHYTVSKYRIYSLINRSSYKLTHCYHSRISDKVSNQRIRWKRKYRLLSLPELMQYDVQLLLTAEKPALIWLNHALHMHNIVQLCWCTVHIDCKHTSWVGPFIVATNQRLGFIRTADMNMFVCSVSNEVQEATCCLCDRVAWRLVAI